MPKQITIQGVVVEVAEPYAEGHTVNEAEAKALNQVRSENIRNNMAKTVKEEVEKAGGDTEKATKAVQKLVTEYDNSYEFTLASVGGGRQRLDPLTKECRSVAKEYIMSMLKEQGMSKKSYEEANGEGKFMEKVVELADHDEIVKVAKENLKEREKLSSGMSGFKL